MVRLASLRLESVWYRNGLGSARCEELPDHLRARLRFHTASHVDAMIEPGMPHQIPHRPAHPRLLIIRPEHELADFGQHNRPRALRTRLDRDVERAVGDRKSTRLNSSHVRI